MTASPFSSQDIHSERFQTIGDLLYGSLEDLKGHDFKRFKDKLSDFSYGGRPPIPHGRMEQADCIATKNHLIDVYGEETALDVTVQVFKLINLMGPVENLKNKIGNNDILIKTSLNSSLTACRKQYMDFIKKKYQSYEDGNARLGETVNLKMRYTRLLLIKKHRDEEGRGHELMSSGRRHLQIMDKRSSDECSSTTIKSLFDPDEGGIIPKIVVLQGPAGIGKTMTSQKIMLDWASGNLYQDKFNYLFYMSCREINHITGKISLAGIVSNMCLLKCSPGLINLIVGDSEKILFIVDGFDELRCFSIDETNVCEDPSQDTSKEILLSCLLRKQVLKDASLIITTRPFSQEKLRTFMKCPRYVEVLGFTGKDREEFFYNFFETKEQADLALSIIKDNDTLFTMCAVPIACWIVCTVIKQQIREGLSVIDSKTSTSIYLLYLKSLLKYHGRNTNQSINTCMKKLCGLANEGVWSQKMLFEEEDIKRHGLSISDIESVFLNENIFQRDVETRTCYSFIHLSVQEFFAALYYVLAYASIRKPIFSQIKKVKQLLEGFKCSPHLQLTVRFLFGLSSEKQIQEAAKCVGRGISFRAKSVLEKWLVKTQSLHHSERLCCLYEAQDADLVKRVISQFFHLEIGSFFNLGTIQEMINYTALSYCLTNSARDHTITICCYTLGQKEQTILSSALHKCSKLCFQACTFPCKVDGTEGSLQTCSSISELFRSHCKMRELVFQFCDLNPSCCEELSSVMITNHSLIKLDLSWNNLLDDGVKHLSEGLRHPGCTLQELKLQFCDLTSSCCDDLRSVITTNPSLIKLDLTGNNLKDSGVKRLCEGLRHPGCTLQELRLINCGLTSSCCDDLCSVIITNKSLIRLDLPGNNLQDTGVRLLSEGLRHPGCTLQDLRWWSCDLTFSCIETLRSVIVGNRSLTTVDLAYSKFPGDNLRESAVRDFTEGFRHSGCTLQELRVSDDHGKPILQMLR